MTKKKLGRPKKEIFVAPEKIKSFEDFMTLIKSLNISISHGDPSNRYDRYGGMYGTAKQKEEAKKKPPYIWVEWSTGGVSGGSCYDTGDDDPHHSYSTGNPPEELTDLDVILENVKPDVTFLQYKSICAEVVEHDSRTENEYYGNHTDYQMKKCSLEKLYQALLSRGMF